MSGFLIAQAAADAAARAARLVDAAARGRGAALRAELTEGDLLLTLGAGDVDQLARRLTA